MIFKYLAYPRQFFYKVFHSAERKKLLRIAEQI